MRNAIKKVVKKMNLHKKIASRGLKKPLMPKKGTKKK